jgi:hypothetical protein
MYAPVPAAAAAAETQLTHEAYASPPTTPKLAPRVDVFRIPLANIQLTNADEDSTIQLEALVLVSDTNPPLK